MIEDALRTLFPDRGVVVAVERYGTQPLFPEEERTVAGAVSSRRAEFAAGRAAARRALLGLGIAAAPIPSGARRAPVWPAGAVGSISHAGERAVAAVARASDAVALGIDLELARPLAPEVERLVVHREDRLGARPLASTVAFSAKESVYKALFPAAGWLLEFADVALELLDDGEFDALATFGGEQRRVRGRYLVTEDFVATAVLVR